MKNTFYRYDKDTKEIIFVNSNKILDICSEPIKHGDFLYFIRPFEWELKGDLIKYNLIKGCIEKELIYYEKEYTIKDILIVDETIYLIIGYVWGTVITGGNLYKCDLDLCNLELLQEFDEKIQIDTLILNSKENLIMKGNKYFDDDYNITEPIELTFKIKKLPK